MVSKRESPIPGCHVQVNHSLHLGVMKSQNQFYKRVNRGQYITNPNNAIVTEIPQQYHTLYYLHRLIPSQIIGILMTPVLNHQVVEMHFLISSQNGKI